MNIYHVRHGSILPLGKQGENMARKIQFDISRWIGTFGPGTVQLLHQRSGDEAPYPVAVEQEGNLAVWTVTSADTAATGTGRAELQYYVGDALAKSETCLTKVLAALGPAGETPPEAQQGWVDQVLQAGTVATEAAEKAVNAAVRQPIVGGNGNWWTWDLEAGAYVDTGIYSSGDAPYIGTNGNWFVGDTDLNVPATGQDGKTAYQYAVEGGYTGTEEAFAAKMAAEIPAVDDTLTQVGQAADAAAVGDRFSQLSGDKVQPDWNQNDSTHPDYVKNRTHYYSVKEIATFSPVNSTEQVLLVPYSDIPELVCVDINGQRFGGLSRDGFGYIGDFGAGGWDEGKGYGFYFKLDKSTKNTICAVDTSRFGVRPNCILYGMYVDKKIPYYYLPRPTATTPGAVKVERGDDLSKYEPCVIDDAGTVYSRKYAPAQVFSDLSGNNLENKLSYVGDHGIFTDSIAEDISSVSELVLPVHAWKIFYDGRYAAYLLESADGKIVKFTYYLGGTGNTPNVEVLHTPFSVAPLIVTYNPDDSTKATATHSSSEIYEAFQSGKTVQFYNDNLRILYRLGMSTPNEAIFIFGGFLDGAAFMTIIVNDSSKIITLGPAIVPHYLEGQDYIELPHIVLDSSTEGSTRQFKLTIDDSGTITATEVM